MNPPSRQLLGSAHLSGSCKIMGFGVRNQTSQLCDFSLGRLPLYASVSSTTERA